MVIKGSLNFLIKNNPALSDEVIKSVSWICTEAKTTGSPVFLFISFPWITCED